MKKKTLVKLNFEFEDNYKLIGFSTGFADYRLAWELNKSLDIQLLLYDKKLEIFDKKIKEDIPFKVFHFFDEELLTSFYLLKNCQNNIFLLPDKLKIDYFLLIRDLGTFDLEMNIISLREIDGITAVFDFRNEPFDVGPLLTF